MLTTVLGNESKVYRESGYKDITLGTSFDDLAKDKSLKWTLAGRPWVFASNPQGGEEFMFDADKKLVCYVKTYDGGPDDYLEQLVDLFGKTDREIKESVSSSADAAIRRTSVNYTFPKVLARVVYVKTIRSIGGRVRTEEQTHVAVIDREWVTANLDADAKGKRKVIAWFRELGDRIKDGEMDPARLPQIDGGEAREYPKTREPVRFVDLRREELNEERKKLKRLQVATAFAGVETVPPPGGRQKGPILRVNVAFDRYTPLAAPAVHGRPDPATAGNPLASTPFGNLVVEMNSALMQEYYPPKSDTIDYVRPSTGAAYYEWRTRRGWLVQCRTDNTISVEWVGGKGL